MQNILGYSAVQAGASFLPMTILVIIVAPIAGRASDRFGSRGLMTAGMLLLSCQLLYFSQLGPDATFWTLLPGLVLGGVGMSMTMTPSTAAATRAVPVEKAGVGAAVLNAFRQVGGSMGIALMGAIMAAQLTTPPTAASFMRRLRERAAGRGRDRARRRDRRRDPDPPARHDARRGGGAAGRRGGMTEVTRPRRLPADERRRAIVEAALRVFSAGSYAGSTTAEIAREAGVSEPVLYRHFASKRDLWSACLDAAWEEFRDGFDHAVGGWFAEGRADGGPAARPAIRAGLLLPPSVARWKKALMPNLWIQGITEAGEDREIRRHVARHMRVVHDHVAGAIRSGQERGVIPPDRDPNAEAWVMIAGGLLRSVADRVGGLLSEQDLVAIQHERMRWLLGDAAGD